MTQAFAVRLADIGTRLDPGYAKASIEVRTAYSSPRFPLVPLGDLVTSIDYGTSERAHSEPSGIPVLRMSNLQDDGLDVTDLKYVQLSTEDLHRFRLVSGDVLVNRTNSKELVGKTAVFNLDDEFVFASYLLRLRFDPAVVDPYFVSIFLNSSKGRLQIDRVSRQIIGMANINTKELRSFLVPLPPIGLQAEFVDDAMQVWSSSRQSLSRAVDAEASTETVIDQAMDVGGDELTPPLAFGVTLSSIRRGRRLDALSYRVPSSAKEGDFGLATLGSLTVVGGSLPNVPPDDEGSVPYVGLPDCSQTRVEVVRRRPVDKVTSRRVAREGDILFARIEPSIFNKKYVWVEGLPDGEVFTSTEFYIVRPAEDVAYPPYIYACLFSAFVASQVEGKTTGSSGRRRLQVEHLKSIEIPRFSHTREREIGDLVLSQQLLARELRAEARLTWDSAKRAFEARLLRDMP